MEITPNSPIIGKVVSGGLKAGDAGVAGEVEAGQIAGEVGVVDGEDGG